VLPTADDAPARTEGQTLSEFVALLASGIAMGCILALAALGFLVLYKATGVVNFAQGDLVTLGAYFGVWGTRDLHLHTIEAYILAIACMFVVGVVFERVAYAPLRQRPPVVMLLATLGVGLVIRSSIALWQGTLPVNLASPVGDNVVHVAGAAVAEQRILIVIVTAVVVGALLIVFSRTQFGRQMRAVASDRETARLQGIRVDRLSSLAFGISASLAGLAGILIAPLGPVDANFGFTIMLSAFAAAILGGFGSLVGVVLAGLPIGLVNQTLGGYLFPDYKDAYPYVLMLLVIAVRPQGLFTSREKARL
jgi:branched-chain amino acid transport system permease protein